MCRRLFYLTFVCCIILLFSGAELRAENWVTTLWMCPNPSGCDDYMQLFKQPDQWPHARKYVKVFKMYGADSEVAEFVTKLKQWHIDFAIEDGAIKEWGPNGDLTADVTLARIGRVEANGGSVKYIAMDEPYWAGLHHIGTYDMQESLEKTIHYMNRIKAEYPDIIIGDIEPYSAIGKDDLKAWITAFKQETGEEFPFFHLDIDRNRADYDVQDVKELKQFCEERGIKFGVIFNNPYLDSETNCEFYSETLDWANHIISNMGMPDQAIIQSWNPKPDCALPENADCTFTRLIRDFAGIYQINLANWATNGSFEQPVVEGFEIDPPGTNWENNGLRIAESGSAFGNTSYEGRQVMVLQNFRYARQTVDGFDPGQCYTVSWAEADRPGTRGGNDMRVLIDDTIVGALHTITNDDWVVCTFPFTATSSSHVLEFETLNSAGGDRSVFVDDVRINLANWVTNGSFEQPVVEGFEINPPGTNWENNGIRIAESGSAFGNTSYDGNQVMVLQNVRYAWQTVDGFEPGYSYTVSWAEADRPGTRGGNDMRVLIDSTIVGALHTITDDNWVVHTSDPFTASSSLHVLEFETLNSAGGDRSVFVDDVRINLANWVTNGSFEQPMVEGFEINPPGTNWENNGLRIAESGSAFGNTSFDGNQVMVLQNVRYARQTVIGLEPGCSYTVSWAEADRPGAYGGNAMRVLIDDTIVGELHTVTDDNWVVCTSDPFTATSSSHVLEFEALNWDSSVFVDDVRINRVQ